MSRLAVLTLVVGLSLASHVKGITAPPLDYHYHRQVNTAAIARNFRDNGLRLLSPQIDWAGPYRGRAATEFPLYMWLVGLFWDLGGLGDIWGRLLSAAFCALAAAYLFLLLERRLGRAPAICGAALFSTIPLTIYFGRTVQPEALALAACIAAVYHWDRHLDADRPLGHWAAAVAAAFLAIAHKLPYAHALLALGALTWLRLGGRGFRDMRVLSAPVLCAASVASWYAYARAGVFVVPTKPGEFLRLLDYGRLPFFAQFQLLSRLPELGATWAGMPLACAGAWELWRRDRFFHLWWLAVAAYIVAGGGYTFYHEYTSLAFVPVMAAFMGAGLASLWRRASRAARPAAAKAALAALVLAMPVNAGFRIKHWYGQNFGFLGNARQAADSVSAAGDLFVCDERAASVYLYYLGRRGWSWDFVEGGVEDTTNKIAAAINSGARFMATRKSQPPPDFAPLLARFPVVYDDGGLVIRSLAERSAITGSSARRRAASSPESQ